MVMTKYRRYISRMESTLIRRADIGDISPVTYERLTKKLGEWVEQARKVTHK